MLGQGAGRLGSPVGCLAGRFRPFPPDRVKESMRLILRFVVPMLLVLAAIVHATGYCASATESCW